MAGGYHYHAWKVLMGAVCLPWVFLQNSGSFGKASGAMREQRIDFNYGFCLSLHGDLRVSTIIYGTNTSRTRRDSPWVSMKICLQLGHSGRFIEPTGPNVI
jgi:hypothetical protein